MSKLVWNKKATDFVIAAHLANRANLEAGKENSLEALTEIAKNLVAHMEHKGIVPTAHSIRSKLVSANKDEGRTEMVYVPATTTTSKPKGGAKTLKSEKVVTLSSHLGLEKLPNTLENANGDDLDAVITSVIQLKSLSILHATVEQLEDAIEAKLEAEQDAIAAGVTPEELNQVEEEVANLVDSATSE